MAREGKKGGALVGIGLDLESKSSLSVLYPAYLVVGVLSWASWSDGNMDTGFYPASGSLEEIIPYMLLLIVFIWV